jgi:hypothetical protein
MLHDLEVYQSWLPSLQSLGFPVGDPTWQYPPGAAIVFLASGAGTIPFRWMFTLVILAFDAAVLVTLMVAHARQQATSWRGVALWSVAALVVGPIMMTRFDVAPTLLAVAAVVLVARPAWSGAMAAVGTVIKVWPALMLLAIPRPSARRGVLSFALTAAGLLLGFWVLFHDSLSFLGNQRDRGLQVESTGALPYLLHSLFGGDVEFGLKYGSIQVLMNGAELVGTLVTFVGFVVLAVMVWWRWSGRLDGAAAGDVALAALLVSLATSRVYSPQFNTWIIGVAAAAVLSQRSRLGTVTISLIVVSLLTQVVYPWSATQLVDAGPFVIVIQSCRIVLLLVATFMALWAISPARTSHTQ